MRAPSAAVHWAFRVAFFDLQQMIDVERVELFRCTEIADGGMVVEDVEDAARADEPPRRTGRHRRPGSLAPHHWSD